jgi:hypothetical protein
MVLKNLVRLVALASLAPASIIPPKLNAFGTGVTIVNSTAPITKSLATRALGTEIYCGCGIGLTTSYTNNVVAAMSANNYVLNPGATYLIEQGDVTAFLCYDGTSQGAIDGSSYNRYVTQLVSGVCGSFIAGTFEFVSNTGDLYVGYMRYGGESAEQICAAARTSPARVALANYNLPFPYIC